MSALLAHPTDEELYDYSRAPELDGFFTLRSHLLACTQCQQRLSSLQQTEQWLIVNGARQRAAESAAGIESADDREALKASLHSAAHHAAMRLAEKDAEQIAKNGAFKVQTSRRRSTQEAPQYIQQLKAFFSLKGLIWVSVPLTAVATMVLAVILLSQISPSGDTNLNVIAVYQDDPVVTFTNEQTAPGIGFFNASKHETVQYSGVKIVANAEGAIHLEWPPVADAESYIIRIFKTQQLPLQDIASLKTSAHRAEFDRLLLTPGRRYGWELSGTTQDGRFFKATGGFVVSK